MNRKDAFDALFMCRFHTSKIGRTANVISQTHIIAACTYVKFESRTGEMHLYVPSSARSQNEEIGEHWKITTNKYTAPSIVARLIIAHKI
jgi:hypothetical protein